MELPVGLSSNVRAALPMLIERWSMRPGPWAIRSVAGRTMRRRWPIAMSIWLVSPGCADVDRDLPAEYRRIAVPESRLAAAEARAYGAPLFQEHCALCHGERGDGRGVRREGLTRSPRDFTNADWRRSASPRRVFYAIREGPPRTPMPAWKALSEQDGWDMTAYVLSLAEQPR